MGDTPMTPEERDIRYVIGRLRDFGMHDEARALEALLSASPAEQRNIIPLKSASARHNEDVLLRMRGVPSREMSDEEAAADPTNPNVAAPPNNRTARTRPMGERPIWRPTHVHEKRGTEYRVIGRGWVQCSDTLSDDEEVVIYQAENGGFWVRPVAEFNDGRFITISAPSQQDAARGDRMLLPCPFCGSAPVEEPWHGGGPDKVFIRCVACEAEPGIAHDDPAEACRIWNRRTAKGEIARGVEDIPALGGDDAIAFQRLLNLLREQEGHSVTLLCDNPDFQGANNAVEVCGDWTNWEQKRFEGETLFAAVFAAAAAYDKTRALAALSREETPEPEKAEFGAPWTVRKLGRYLLSLSEEEQARGVHAAYFVDFSDGRRRAKVKVPTFSWERSDGNFIQPFKDETNPKVMVIWSSQDERPHHPEAGGAPDLSRIAKSLADMLTEYVQGGIDSNQNWRNGLNEIIARRLQRLLPTGGAPGREEITVAIFKRAFHLEDVATSELIQKRKQDFAPVWEHAEECADAILALFPNTRPVSGSSEDGR